MILRHPNFPNAVQHGRASSAVRLCLVFPDMVESVKDTKACRRFASFRRWRDEAAEALGAKPLGHKADRIILEQVRRIGRALGFESGPNWQSKEVDPEALATVIVAVLHLVMDARIACPAWAVGRPWYEMDRMAFTLCRDIIKDYPASEEQGVALAFELADIMEAA